MESFWETKGFKPKYKDFNRDLFLSTIRTGGPAYPAV